MSYTMYGFSAGPTPGPRPALCQHLSDLNRHSSKRKWAVSRSRAAAQTDGVSWRWNDWSQPKGF